jgi:hypothetical protein
MPQAEMSRLPETHFYESTCIRIGGKYVPTKGAYSRLYPQHWSEPLPFCVLVVRREAMLALGAVQTITGISKQTERSRRGTNLLFELLALVQELVPLLCVLLFARFKISLAKYRRIAQSVIVRRRGRTSGLSDSPAQV